MLLWLPSGSPSGALTPGAGISSEYSLGFHASLLGAGGAGTALLGSAAAARFNPALYATLEYQEVALSFTTLANQAYLGDLTWSLPISDMQGIGLSVSGLGSGELSRVRDYDASGTFRFSSTLATVAYGRRLYQPLAVGATLKVINQSLDQFSDYGIGFDLGLSFQPVHAIALGASALNILEPEIKLNNRGERQQRSWSFGLAMTPQELFSRVTVGASGSVEWFDGYAGRYSGGISATLDSLLTIRGGYQVDRFAVGVGLRQGRITIDYAARFLRFLPDEHTVSLSFAIGPSVQERRAQREAERQAAIDEADRRRRYEQNRLTGKEFADRFELDSALVYYQRALAFNESNQELRGAISSLQDAIAAKRESDLKLAATEAETRQAIRSYYDQANQLYEKGSYRAALDLLALLMEVQPDNAQALDLATSIKMGLDSAIHRELSAADSALSAGRNVEAITGYARVLEYDSTNSRARNGKGTALLRLDKALQLNLAIDAFNKGALDDAERRFRAVQEAAGSVGEPTAAEYLARIDVLRRRPVGAGIIPSAPVTLDQLQQDKPTWALYLEGLRLMRNRQYDEAIKLWQQVLGLYPNQSNTVENIKQARLRQQPDSTQQR